MTVIIGIDPHKASHTAVAINELEQPLARLCVAADRSQTDRLLAWAELFDERRWAIESAAGLGKLLAQQLVAAGEDVVDVPPTLSARVRLLGSTKAAKNDANDALSTAIAGLRHGELRQVAREDHRTVLRLLADRHHDLVALRTQAVCRLHVALRELVAGGAPRRLNASGAADLLRAVRPDTAVGIERKQLARDLLVDVRRLDRDLAAIKERITDAVAASETTLTELFGVGPVVAALILGHVGDPARFPTRERFAAYNGTAPIEASSRRTSPPPTQPARKPHAQPCDPSHRGHPDRARHPRARLLRPQTRRRQDPQGSAARAQATDQRRGLATTTRRPRAHLTSGPGRTTRNDSDSSVTGATS